MKLSKKYKNGQKETIRGQLNYEEPPLVANPKSVFSTVALGSSRNMKPFSNLAFAPGRKPMDHNRLHWQVIGMLFATLWMTACGSPQSTPSSGLTSEPSEFSIYLLAQPAAAHEGSTPGALDLEQEPILSIGDIIAYFWDTHTIELTTSAYQRIEELLVPVNGSPFVVCLGREPVYAGAFWPIYSSLSYDGVVIELPLMDDHTMQISLGYPSPSFFMGLDPRSDPGIKQSLQRAGVLR